MHVRYLTKRVLSMNIFAVVVLLKCLQYLGYVPELAGIPGSIVNKIRVCLRLPLQMTPVYDQTRTMRRRSSRAPTNTTGC